MRGRGWPALAVAAVVVTEGLAFAPKILPTSKVTNKVLVGNPGMPTLHTLHGVETKTMDKTDQDIAEEITDISYSDQRMLDFSYGAFAKQFPFANNLMIATLKTAAADLLAQTVIAQTPVTEIDLQRSLLFCLFGAIYLGAFQYAYQVQVFKKLFDVDKFTAVKYTGK